MVYGWIFGIPSQEIGIPRGITHGPCISQLQTMVGIPQGMWWEQLSL